jgi:hypothetical protein
MKARRIGMKKELIIGKDYGPIFGLNPLQGQHMIYNGGISWTAKNGDLQFTDDAQETNEEALNHLSMMDDPRINPLAKKGGR